jgi:hypothetical protein
MKVGTTCSRPHLLITPGEMDGWERNSGKLLRPLPLKGLSRSLCLNFRESPGNPRQRRATEHLKREKKKKSRSVHTNLCGTGTVTKHERHRHTWKGGPYGICHASRRRLRRLAAAAGTSPNRKNSILYITRDSAEASLSRVPAVEPSEQ